MVIALLILVVFIVKFLIDRNTQKEYLKKQGGMKNKYQSLIHKIIQSTPDFDIIKETSHDITLATIKSIAGQTTITLTQSFRRLIVEWRVHGNSNSSYGNHNLRWEFDEFKDQNEIFKKINYDIGEYSNNVTSNIEKVNSPKTDYNFDENNLKKEDNIKSSDNNTKYVFSTDLNVYRHRNNENAFLCKKKNIRKGELRHLHIDEDEVDFILFNKEKALKMLESWLNLKYNIENISDLINSVACTKDDYEYYNESGSIDWEFDYTDSLNKDFNLTDIHKNILDNAVKNWSIPFDVSNSQKSDEGVKKMYTLGEMEDRLLKNRPELKESLKNKTLKEKNKILLDYLDNNVNHLTSSENISEDNILSEKESQMNNEELQISNLKFIKAYENRDSMITFFIHHHGDSELIQLFGYGGIQFGATEDMLNDYTYKYPEIGKKFIDFLEKEGIDSSNYKIF